MTHNCCQKQILLDSFQVHSLPTSKNAEESNEDHLEMARMNEYERKLYIEHNTGYHGRLVWRMPNYRAHRREAIDRNLLCVTSPSPCYTCRYGYKYCLRVHLHGDHDLSISILQMQTDLDNILEWPVTHGMRLTLYCQIDQTKNKVRTFERCVIKKPNLDEKIVKYWHFVHPFASLEKDGFVVDDCMFTELIVE